MLSLLRSFTYKVAIAATVAMYKLQHITKFFKLLKEEEFYNNNNNVLLIISFFITKGTDKQILIWDIDTATQLRDFTGHTDTIYQLEFSRDNAVLASGTYIKG